MIYRVGVEMNRWPITLKSSKSTSSLSSELDSADESLSGSGATLPGSVTKPSSLLIIKARDIFAGGERGP